MTNDSLFTVRDLVVEAALTWWLNKRPIGWNTEDHLENPTINCSTEVDLSLAKAVAAQVTEEW